MIMEPGNSAWITFILVMCINANQLLGSSPPAYAPPPPPPTAPVTELDMNAQGMTCVDFTTLNNMKQLEKIIFQNGNMPFFPDKDCNSQVREEDNRPLDLPNLKELILKEINLLKVPNVSLMPQLHFLDLFGNEITTAIPPNHFVNNKKLTTLELTQNKFPKPPDLAGSCDELKNLSLNYNNFTSFPSNYFDGCTKMESLSVYNSEQISFPNVAPIGKTVDSITFGSNKISGIITNDMVKDLKNLRKLSFNTNVLQGFHASLCQNSHPVELILANNLNLTTFENPYRFCPHMLDNFDIKPKIGLTSTKIPCDHHRCWMKKFASKFTIEIDDCPDGRTWSQMTEADVCGQGKMGHGVVGRQDNQARFISALPPARNIITMETRKEWSQHRCAFQCFKIAACSYFEYAADSENCSLKRLE